MVRWHSLAIPFAYLGILVASLAAFSFLYRSRKAAKAASLAPWFGPHVSRNLYLSLLHIQPDYESPSNPPDSMIKAALLRRATEDIRRVLALRTAKPALSTLLLRGSVDDELWQRFQIAEGEVEEEIQDVVKEADALAPNWGQTIFLSANEMLNQMRVRATMEETLES